MAFLFNKTTPNIVIYILTKFMTSSGDSGFHSHFYEFIAYFEQ